MSVGIDFGEIFGYKKNTIKYYRIKLDKVRHIFILHSVGIGKRTN